MPSSLEAVRKERGRRNYRLWLEQTSPEYHWDWAYQKVIHQNLQLVTDGVIHFLMIMAPYRHGKSEGVTVRYPIFRIDKDRTCRTLIAAHAFQLASKFGRKARRVADKRGIELASDRKAVHDYETPEGGGVRSVGVKGVPMGEGFDLIVIDDPVKGHEQANSLTYRDAAWEWWKNDIYTRLEPGGAVIIIMTRWNEDDLAGRILASPDGKNWTVIRMPGIAESQEERIKYHKKIGIVGADNDPLGRKEGEPLCIERGYDLKKFAEARITLGSRSFNALVQQRPTAAEGDFIKRHWLKRVRVAPSKPDEIIRYWDKAGTEGGGKKTAGVRMSKKDGKIYIEHRVSGQWEAPEREKVIKQTAFADGIGVKVRGEQEPGSGGKESAQATIRNLAGFNVKMATVTGDKITRAEPFAVQAEAGNVYIVDGDWNNEYIDGLCSFPNGKFSDDMDATSGAFNEMHIPQKRVGLW